MRLNRRPGTGSASSSGAILEPASYGFDVPAFDPDALPGDTIAERAAAYVDGLDLERSTPRGLLRFRVECLLDDLERTRDGRPSYDDEILDDL